MPGDPVDNDKIVDLLKNVDLFRGMSAREVNRLRSSGRDTEHDEGHTVVEETGTGLGFHLVIEGTAAVSQRGQHLRDIGPGDYFGEISLLDGGTRSATVVATSPLRTLYLNSTKFNMLLDEQPEMARTVMIALCKRLRALENAGVDVAP